MVTSNGDSLGCGNVGVLLRCRRIIPLKIQMTFLRDTLINILSEVNVYIIRSYIITTGRPKWSCTWVGLTQIWGVPLAGGLLL